MRISSLKKPQLRFSSRNIAGKKLEKIGAETKIGASPISCTKVMIRRLCRNIFTPIFMQLWHISSFLPVISAQSTASMHPRWILNILGAKKQLKTILMRNILLSEASPEVLGESCCYYNLMSKTRWQIWAFETNKVQRWKTNLELSLPINFLHQLLPKTLTALLTKGQ